MRIIVSVCIFLQLLGYAGNIRAQSGRNVILSGIIRDQKNGEHLTSATIWIPALELGTSTNNFGYYSIALTPGTYTIETSYVGYQKLIHTVLLLHDSVLNQALVPGVEVGEVSVTATRREVTLLNGVLPGIYNLSARKIELSPALLGESDVLKTIQYLPGVKAGNEGTSGIQVRGGSHDQNLILLDGVPVYNTSHLFGYLSTFNTDAIRDVRFYKGGIPARFGGRLSSVVDITMKEGNMKKATGQFTLSPVAGKIMYEGPIKKDAASFMISGRRSWLDLPLHAIRILSGDSGNMGYSFYDLNVKLNWYINQKNRIFLSHYQGRDGYFMNWKDSSYRDNYNFQWGNFTSVVRWNSILSPRLFVNTSAYYSLYNFRERYLIIRKNESGQVTSSGLRDLTVKSDFDLCLKNHLLRFGYQLSNQSFRPEITILSADTTGLNLKKPVETVSGSFTLYLEDEMKISSKLDLQPGVRLFTYYSGKRTEIYWEPRVAARYNFRNDLHLKVSVQKMVQPIHLLTHNALNMPTDLWVTSGADKLPSEAWLYDLGIHQLLSPHFNLGMDIYFKPMKNLLEYKPGVSLLAGSGKSWEEITIAGQGINYGTEIMIEKNTGRMTGWLGYTLSWAKRKFNEINNGNYFPYKHDRRHDMTLSASYKVKEADKKLNQLSMAFIFASGNAITIPDKHIPGSTLPGIGKDFNYSDHFSFYESFPYPNNYRMPSFHHLDLTYSCTKQLKKERERVWKFSVYNVYNRMNPYFYYKRRDRFMQISMLPFIPSVSYSLKF